MMKVLFMIPNLGHGGAEKVLVNLVNHMDQTKFDITVMSLYDEGVNKQFLKQGIRYKSCMKRSFPGVAHMLKLFTPEWLYNQFVKEHYDIVVSYLEGQTARIVSGCTKKETRIICWIHRTMTTLEDAARLFRSEEEAMECYGKFDSIVSVSKDVQMAFMKLFSLEEKGIVIYNTNESELILEKSLEDIEEQNLFIEDEFKICAMGTLIPVKGFDRLINIHSKLKEKKYPIHTYILGEGADKEKLQRMTREYNIQESVTFLGYQKNPYKYMKKCDLFVCSSYSEGFSTAVTEALILGIPVVTTKVSGMEELLGENNEYGVITANNEEDLCVAIEKIISNPSIMRRYRNESKKQGKKFRVKETVDAAENLFLLHRID